MKMAAEVVEMVLDSRAWALVEAINDWGKMRYHMELAHPGMTYDCWFSVSSSLCSIAQNIIEARQRAEEEKEQDNAS